MIASPPTGVGLGLRWAFLDEVPKTSVGKFDKKVLRADYAEGRLRVESL